MPSSTVAMDEIFRALADPTRRRVLERLSKGPASVSELAEPFDMKLPSFVQHLGILEKSQLIASHKKGRVRTYQINPRRMQLAEDWLAKQRQIWESRLDRLEAYLNKLQEDESPD